MTYHDFLTSKLRSDEPTGFDVPPEALGIHLFDYQRAIVRWSLRRGRAAIFADCGLGKGPMTLEWLSRVSHREHGPTLLLAPLAVAQQFEREAEKFGAPARYTRDGKPSGSITITNYEQLHKFDPSDYAGVALDESSILKSYNGKFRNEIIDAFASTRFRLACTATPAPNDHMELGNHAEFMGVMSRVEMLATYFVHDGGETQKWRLKGHAEADFWRWVASWAVMLRRPSDIGFTDEGFNLPELRFFEHVAEVDHATSGSGSLFLMPASTMPERRQARRRTLEERARIAADLVNGSDEPWIVWCDLNAEGNALERLIPDAIQISGSDDDDAKTSKMMGFVDGAHRVLVTKPQIAGFGLNLQHCARQAFVGLSDSYERFYQAVRRSWRFGQKRSVEIHVVISELEGAVLKNIKRKEEDADRMAFSMVEHMGEITRSAIGGAVNEKNEYFEAEAVGDGWRMLLGDCVEHISRMEPNSVDFSIFSPPFASLYTYSNSERDMGNVLTHAQFFEHFSHLVPELFRVVRPGRLISFHCMNLPTSKARDGVIGITDFRGGLIRAFEAAGWIFHSEVCIWKDPVTAMQRTKAIGLLHKQLKKDSCLSRQGIPDYLVTMRKPGDNSTAVSHTNETFPVAHWQRYASPVWMDIAPNDTLQHRSAREEKDERHICPLQLDVIRRALRLWSNAGELVLSPFAGIGSEGYVALEEGRRFVGTELKRSYYEQACRNLEGVRKKQVGLFEEGAA